MSRSGITRFGSMGIISALKTENGERKTENYDFLKKWDIDFSFQLSVFSFQFFQHPSYVTTKVQKKYRTTRFSLVILY